MEPTQDLAPRTDDLTDAWFVELDGLDSSDDPAHLAYDEEPPRPHPLRFVLVLSCALLAVAACVGATV